MNWLATAQKLSVSVQINEKPSPATVIIAANSTEVAPNGTKEFPIRYYLSVEIHLLSYHMLYRFISPVEGTSKAIITFTNPLTNEYLFFALTAVTTASEVIETINLESPVRQIARHVITLENPLPLDVPITMGELLHFTSLNKIIKLTKLNFKR